MTEAPPAPHIIHLLRTLQQNQLQLIQMADLKANILIGGALILLTVLAAQLVRADANPVLLVLTVSVVLAAACAILAAKPRILTPPKAESGTFNLLFFGHFDSLGQDRFIERMEQLIHDEDESYRAVIRDIYQAGHVLRNKYRYLAWSYRIFIAGLAITAVGLMVQFIRA